MQLNIGVLVVGIIFFAVGVLLLVRQLKSRRNNIASATAEVIGYDTKVSHNSDGADNVVYFPIMRFWASGQWCEARSDTGRGRQKYALGAQVDILYDPQHPQSFTIVGDKTAMVMSVICTLLGVGVCVLSFFAE